MNIDAHIREAKQYRLIVEGAVASIAPEIPACAIGGIMSRESGCGLLLTPPGPGGTGDHGHGHGLMQIDDRWHGDFLADGTWMEPATNIGYGVGVLCGILQQVRTYARRRGSTIDDRGILRVAVAGYNCGGWRAFQAWETGDPDRWTTGGNYAEDVSDRARQFRAAGWS